MKRKSKQETGPPGRECRRLEAFLGYDPLKFSSEKPAEPLTGQVGQDVLFPRYKEGGIGILFPYFQPRWSRILMRVNRGGNAVA